MVVGPGGDPDEVIDAAKNAEITGQQYAAQEEKELPLKNPPALIYKGSQPTGTISSSGRYDEIVMDNQEELYIVGDVILEITGNVELDNLAFIEVTEGSSLVLYVGGEFDLSNNAKVNNLTKSPPRCIIYGTASEEVDYLWDNVSDFYGAIYAPNANIEVMNNSSIFGALVGNQLTIHPNAELHGDRALMEGSVNDPDAKFVIKGWRE